MTSVSAPTTISSSGFISRTHMSLPVGVISSGTVPVVISPSSPSSSSSSSSSLSSLLSTPPSPVSPSLESVNNYGSSRSTRSLHRNDILTTAYNDDRILSNSINTSEMIASSITIDKPATIMMPSVSFQAVSSLPDLMPLEEMDSIVRRMKRTSTPSLPMADAIPFWDDGNGFAPLKQWILRRRTNILGSIRNSSNNLSGAGGRGDSVMGGDDDMIVPPNYVRWLCKKLGARGGIFL